ncbi:MAG: hypothetical protein Unbinned4336contig1001_12 [Prokaryotic dsDNA virus sp.]|nr:MAG: hypothetical protein Unbinned4336contig1001_12 [Prokaryotic dsDNA virus sp.]|tara:strand:- start:5699 stop:6280 length:582 start_codon:yes stop_codon:yes gene_type:complete
MPSVLGSLGSEKDQLNAKVSQAVGVPAITQDSLAGMNLKQLMDLKGKLTTVSVRQLAGGDKQLEAWEAQEVAAAQRKAGITAATTLAGGLIGGLSTGLATGGMGAPAGIGLGSTGGALVGTAAGYLDPHEWKRGSMGERQQGLVDKTANMGTALTQAIGLVDAAIAKKEVTKNALGKMRQRETNKANRWSSKA